MKKVKFISTVIFSTAISIAAAESAAPESYIPTPAEKSEISRESPNLGQKERAAWQRMREERKQAREQILSRLRESSATERQMIRKDLSKNRNEMPRFEGDFPKNSPREPRPFWGKPDSHEGNPMRGQQEPPDKGGSMGK
jgi:hypothetical protein